MKNELVLRLVGLHLGVNEHGDEFGFWHRRFRKLSDIQAENAARHAESALENEKDQRMRRDVQPTTPSTKENS